MEILRDILTLTKEVSVDILKIHTIDLQTVETLKHHAMPNR